MWYVEDHGVEGRRWVVSEDMKTRGGAGARGVSRWERTKPELSRKHLPSNRVDRARPRGSCEESDWQAPS